MQEDDLTSPPGTWVGVVESVDGMVAYVQIPSPVGCSCGQRGEGGCCSSKTIRVRASVESTRGLRPGDRVVLQPPQGNPWLGAFQVLVLPAILSALAFHTSAGLPSPWPAAAAVGAFFLGILPLLTLKRRTTALPRIVEILPLYSPLKK